MWSCRCSPNTRDGNRTEPEPSFYKLDKNPNRTNPGSHRTRTEPNPNNEGSFPSLELPLCLPKILISCRFPGSWHHQHRQHPHLRMSLTLIFRRVILIIQLIFWNFGTNASHSCQKWQILSGTCYLCQQRAQRVNGFLSVCGAVFTETCNVA